jgi:hypothetical protein
METAANKAFCFSQYPQELPKQFIKKRMSGEIIQRYDLGKCNEYLLYIEDVKKFEDLPSSVQEQLEKHRKKLAGRAEIKRNENSEWWKYTFPLHKEYYHLPKIWCSYRSKNNAFILDETDDYIGLTNTTVIFGTNSEYSLKYLLALLNSTLLTFRYKSIGKQTGGGVFEYFANGVGKLPIPQISLSEQQPLIDLADRMLSLHVALQDRRERFSTLLSNNLGVTISESRINTLKEFKYFLEELKKQKRPIPLAEQPQWQTSFDAYHTEVAAIQTTIRQTDAEIDRQVYGLYGLNEEEIKIVNG